MSNLLSWSTSQEENQIENSTLVSISNDGCQLMNKQQRHGDGFYASWATHGLCTTYLLERTLYYCYLFLFKQPLRGRLNSTKPNKVLCDKVAQDEKIEPHPKFLPESLAV
jgi:hypothetical protein